MSLTGVDTTGTVLVMEQIILTAATAATLTLIAVLLGTMAAASIRYHVTTAIAHRRGAKAEAAYQETLRH